MTHLKGRRRFLVLATDNARRARKQRHDMNDNRYAPPKALVADSTMTADERSEIGGPALRLAARLLWGGISLGLLSTVLSWNDLTANAPQGAMVGVLTFTFSILALLTYNIGRARNWARIVMLVFMILGLPSLAGLPAIFQRAPLLASLSVVQTVIQLSAMGIVFFSSARYAFRKRG